MDKKEKLILDDLLSQLEGKETAGEYHKDLAKDYVALWRIKNKLIKDIEERGVSVGWNNGGGQQGVKKNDSVAELVKVNAQMLKILSELGLKVGESKGEGDDEI